MDVASNVETIVNGVGAFTIANLIKPRFLRIFRQTHIDSLLHLIKRPSPGEGFTVTLSSTASEILNAVQYGLATSRAILGGVVDLMDEARKSKDSAGEQRCKDFLDLIKTLDKIDLGGAALKSSEGVAAFTCGILSYVWAKVSFFVMKAAMDAHRVLDISESDGSDSTTLSTFTSKISRPATMEEFSEMMNLFAMYAHALGFATFLVLSDFYEHVVYDTIRLRKQTWHFAHEVMLVMFRRVEDSGGKLSLGTVYNESHLNTIMDEARVNDETFFRSVGGNPNLPIIPGQTTLPTTGTTKTYNGKFTAKSSAPCPFFNRKGQVHPARSLLADGTCKFNHVCNHWVSHKGSKGRCMGEEGTPGHTAVDCTHSKKCAAPVP